MRNITVLSIVVDRSSISLLIKPTNVENVGDSFLSAAALCRHVFVDVRLPLASEY